MRGRAGSVRIWHWAHVVRNPHCEAARESEWHLGWKVLGADGSQEVQVGSRRADVLAPGGFAVEFQASALAAGEVRSREDDWGAQGGLVWVFKADKEFAAGRIVLSGSFRGCDESLLRPENRATLDVTWSRAPGRVRAAHAPSFLDLGDGDLLFVGGWWSRSSLLTGYGWRVSRAWVAERVLRGSLVPGPLAEDPAKVRHELAQWIWQVDDEDRLERLRHSEAQEADRTGEGRPRFTARPQEELKATTQTLPRPESKSDLSPPTRGFVITPILRAWRLAREAERAGESEDSASADPPDSASVP
jgi:hypothetical protein